MFEQFTEYMYLTRWQICQLPLSSEGSKLLSSYPLTRGSASGPRWGLRPRPPQQLPALQIPWPRHCKPPFQFIHTMDLSVVDRMLHDSPDLVIHRTEIWAVWRPQPQLGRKKVRRFLMQQFNCCVCMCGAVCWCTVLLE